MINKEIRIAAKQNKVRMWEVAEALGIQDSAFSRKLRHELPDAERERVLEIISSLSVKKREAV